MRVFYNHKFMKEPFISYFSGAMQPAFQRTIYLAILFSILSVNTLHGEPPPVILAFGDSLTAGFGVTEQESYPSRLQEILKQHKHPHQVINAGVSGDTTAGGLRRINWLLKQKPEIVILELGANDGLRGLPLAEMYSNLEQIVQLCRDAGARILLAGMKIPPNYGAEYTQGFEDMFHRLAEQYQLNFIPFFLEGVAAKREYTRPDGIHPLGAGYKIVAETVWQGLEPML